jgi:hypothetical protein|tara:strand:- start:154 stop:753 length:600 start_codon:yes stop_codon:yes gene_type:complete
MENKIYEVSDFFKGYAGGCFSSPEEWIQEDIIPNLSKNIKYIVDFGCANGRNFSPFIEKGYECIGLDIHPESTVNHSCTFRYYTYSIEDFIKNPNEVDINWEKSLVMTHGTLMYCVDSATQNLFIDTLKSKNCKNFLFHEYTSDIILKNGNLNERTRNNGLGWVNLNSENLKLFSSPLGNKKNYRDAVNDMHALIYLQK